MEDEVTTTDDQPSVDLGDNTTTESEDDDITETLDSFERQAIGKFVITLVAIIGLNTAVQSVPATPIATLLIGFVAGLSSRSDGYVSSLVGGGAGGAVAVLLTSFVGVLVTLGGTAVFWGIVGALTAGVGTFLGSKLRERVQ